MASNYTSNYNLCQWAASDKVLRTEFNADNAKIDAALASKAEKSVVTALQTGKASQTALDALSATVSGHTAQLAKTGNCKIVFESYTGNGNYGVGGENTRTFSGKPLFVAFTNGQALLCAVQGMSNIYSSSQVVGCKWSGNSVSLSSQNSAGSEMNADGVSYHVLALIAADD